MRVTVIATGFEGKQTAAPAKAEETASVSPFKMAAADADDEDVLKLFKR
jgi:hypothetical protein